MRIFNLLATSYLLVIIGLFFYSFTQVDLGLTLTQWSIWQIFQTFFQHIGYFQRPLSTYFYSGLIILLFIFYCLTLWLVKKKKITKKQLWIIIIGASVILFFSYNAFSYDLFNYIFDAKIVTHYHQNPYEHKALDYFGEPMLGFMHWTHRTYPYGPVWLLLTVPLSFVGFGYFLGTLMLFKLLMLVSYLATVFFLGKILRRIAPQNELFGLTFFALNPLVIIESLISAHHDIVMMAFVFWGLFLLIEKKYVRSLILLILSVGIKFASIFFLPMFIGAYMLGRKKTIDWQKLFMLTIALMTLSVIFASFRTELQPWYLLWVLPLVALCTTKKWLVFPAITMSFGLMLHYIPYFYTGNWDPPIPTIKFWITIVSLGLGVVLYLIFRLFAARKHF